MVDPCAMVKVGNSECGFLKLTPLSRTAAIAGAVSGVTIRPRNPSGTNRIRLRGVLFCAEAVTADRIAKLADRIAVFKRMDSLPRANFDTNSRCLCLVLLYDGFVTSSPSVPSRLYAIPAGLDPALRLQVNSTCSNEF